MIIKKQFIELADIEKKFFRRCFELAKKAFNEEEVPVACVLTFDGVIIGEGHNDVNRCLILRITNNQTKLH